MNKTAKQKYPLACALLDGEQISPRRYRYYDDGTGSCWTGPVSDLRDLEEMLRDDIGDAYSHWCASTTWSESSRDSVDG
jgi:hypothetical protein